MSKYDFDSLEQGLIDLWDTMEFTPAKRAAAEDQAGAIAKNAGRYQAIGDPLGIPWPMIGFIHEMECSLNFKKHLHNGDPLTGFTFQIPRGRPHVGHAPPFTFEESAVDALKFDGLDKWGADYWWTEGAILFNAERFNGFGYRGHGVNSPYLWAGSQHYKAGKYVSDGVWSATAVSGQIGVALLLRVIIDGGLWVPEPVGVDTVTDEV